jgi:hypothetical protein
VIGHSVRVRLSPYSEVAPLDRFYFEDSYVRAISASGARFTLTVEAVLTPQHPNFGMPKGGEQYAYEHIVLRFENARVVIYEPSGVSPSVDSGGEEDLGNIDSFRVGEDGYFLLEGEWGTVETRWGNTDR